MFKISNNEILIGTDENGYTHYGFVTKNKIAIEDAVIKIISLEFSLESKQYEINISDNSVIGYILNDTNKFEEFVEGVCIVDTTNLTDIKLEVDGGIKYFKLDNYVWSEYAPDPEPTELEKMQEQIDQLTLAILQMGA